MGPDSRGWGGSQSPHTHGLGENLHLKHGPKQDMSHAKGQPALEPGTTGDKRLKDTLHPLCWDSIDVPLSAPAAGLTQLPEGPFVAEP